VRIYPAILAIGLLVLANSSTSIGGLAVNGVGFGNSYTTGGQPFCLGHAFEAHAVFLPENKGVLFINYLGGQSCALSNGGGVFLGTFNTGSMSFRFVCNGNEGVGLVCESVILGGELVRASIGPYLGPGSMVEAYFQDSFRQFRGQFVAI
jgi:hypothetical protein